VIDRADDMALIVEARALLVNSDGGVVPNNGFTPEERGALPPLGPSLRSEDAEAAFREAHQKARRMAG